MTCLKHDQHHVTAITRTIRNNVNDNCLTVLVDTRSLNQELISCLPSRAETENRPNSASVFHLRI